MATTQNIDIREKAMTSGIKLWQLAEGLGMADSTLSRILRKELSDEAKEHVFNVIDAISKGTDIPTLKGLGKSLTKKQQKPAYSGYLNQDIYLRGSENFKTDILET